MTASCRCITAAWAKFIAGVCKSQYNGVLVTIFLLFSELWVRFIHDWPPGIEFQKGAAGAASKAIQTNLSKWARVNLVSGFTIERKWEQKWDDWENQEAAVELRGFRLRDHQNYQKNAWKGFGGSSPCLVHPVFSARICIKAFGTPSNTGKQRCQKKLVVQGLVLPSNDPGCLCNVQRKSVQFTRFDLCIFAECHVHRFVWVIFVAVPGPLNWYAPGGMANFVYAWKNCMQNE